jgi:hypothetical protein
MDLSGVLLGALLGAAMCSSAGVLFFGAAMAELAMEGFAHGTASASDYITAIVMARSGLYMLLSFLAGAGFLASLVISMHARSEPRIHWVRNSRHRVEMIDEILAEQAASVHSEA